MAGNTLKDDLQAFCDRHNFDERQEALKVFCQAPFLPLEFDASPAEQQRRTWERFQKIQKTGYLEDFKTQYPTAKQQYKNFARFSGAAIYDMSLATLIAAQLTLAGKGIQTMGSEEQKVKYVDDIFNLKIRGCFAMTELGHGSNVRDIETQATYLPEKQQFEIHTPCDSAQKFWIGNGLGANLAVVMAQLMIKGEQFGVHAFVVHLRNENGELKPGVRVASCGHKMGLNGIANARMWFNRVCVDRDALLSRYSEVSPEGEYSSPIPDKGLRFTVCLAELVGGRMGLVMACVNCGKVGLTTAVRYALTRRQFRVGNQAESLIMDYPIHQQRLIPCLAILYSLQCAAHHIQHLWISRSDELMERLQQMKTIHFISSGLKAISGWYVRDMLQACREACGGQGYASWNRIGILKADIDAAVTYEGDNFVLMMQCARQLMRQYKKGQNGVGGDYTSDGFLAYLNSGVPFISNIAKKCELRSLLEMLQCREAMYMEQLSKDLDREMKGRASQEAEDMAWNACGQEAVECGKAFIERLIFEWFVEDIQQVAQPQVYPVLQTLTSLYGLWVILGDPRFCGSSHLPDSVQIDLRKEYNKCLPKLRPHVKVLVDGFGIPDVLLGRIANVSGSNDPFWSYEQTLQNSGFVGKAKL